MRRDYGRHRPGAARRQSLSLNVSNRQGLLPPRRVGAREDGHPSPGPRLCGPGPHGPSNCPVRPKQAAFHGCQTRTPNRRQRVGEVCRDSGALPGVSRTQAAARIRRDPGRGWGAPSEASPFPPGPPTPTPGSKGTCGRPGPRGMGLVGGHRIKPTTPSPSRSPPTRTKPRPPLTHDLTQRPKTRARPARQPHPFPRPAAFRPPSSGQRPPPQPVGVLRPLLSASLPSRPAVGPAGLPARSPPPPGP